MISGVFVRKDKNMAIANFEEIIQGLTYQSYCENMLDNISMYIRQNSAELKEHNIKPSEYMYGNAAELVICPEPINFLSEITREERTEDKLRRFEELKRDFKKYTISKPADNYWPNQTANGINIRLGNKDNDKGNQYPAVLGDDCVHGVIVGRTGAGKSVLINNIILNLIAEYSPWELDLFLVDMKKVELSRYMTKLEGETDFITPQISACAATSEVRYVVSMIEYLAKCMKARQSLFAALGVQKLSDFRDKFGVKLPRVLLLVDEFQQLFLEASGKERRILDECIIAITKLGRATGFHLLFASQEMSGALDGKTLANFKLRIALPCDEGVSTQILGNSAAAKLTEKGITLVNQKGGSSADDNIEYRTPFVNDKSDDPSKPSEFMNALKKVFLLTKQNDFKKNQKFYQEDVQDKIETIKLIKNDDRIKNQISNAKGLNKSIIDAFVLGSGVLYTNKAVDYESVFIELGKRRNIGVLCVKDEDIVNVIRTLSQNFINSENSYSHYIDYESELLRSGYAELIDELSSGNNNASEINFSDIPELVYEGFILSDCYKSLEKISDDDSPYIRYGKRVRNLLRELFLKKARTLLLNQMDASNSMIAKHNGKAYAPKKDPLLELFGKNNSRCVDLFNSVYDSLDDELSKSDNIKDVHESIAEKFESVAKNATEEYEKSPADFNKAFDAQLKNVMPLILKYYEKDPFELEEEPPLSVVWILGMDNLDNDADKYLCSILDICTTQNILFVLAGNSLESDRSNNPFKFCNYVFLNSPHENVYSKFKMSYTKRSDENKAIDFKIMNFNAERSFKQFYFEGKPMSAPKLNFDDWR